MNSEHGHGPNWYRLFVVSIAVFDFFLLFMVSQCSFTLENPLSAVNTFLCGAYVAFAVLCLVVGVFISFIGIEHAKRKGKNPRFYYLAIIYFFAAILAVAAYKLF